MKKFLNECFSVLRESDEEWYEFLEDEEVVDALSEVTEDLAREMIMNNIELLAEHGLLLLESEDEEEEIEPEEGGEVAKEQE